MKTIDECLEVKCAHFYAALEQQCSEVKQGNYDKNNGFTTAGCYVCKGISSDYECQAYLPMPRKLLDKIYLTKKNDRTY